MIKIEKIATEKAKELNKLRGYTSNGLTFISIYTAIVDAFQEFEKYNDKKVNARIETTLNKALEGQKAKVFYNTKEKEFTLYYYDTDNRQTYLGQIKYSTNSEQFELETFKEWTLARLDNATKNYRENIAKSMDINNKYEKIEQIVQMWNNSGLTKDDLETLKALF